MLRSGNTIALKIRVDDGIDTNHADIADRKLLEKLQALDQLPDTDHTIIKAALDTYITKHAIQQLTGEPAA